MFIEKQAFLLVEMSKQYEKGSGYRSDLKEPEDIMSLGYDDVNEKTAEVSLSK